MATLVGDSGNSYALETFTKPPPKKKWIQDYLEKAPPSPQVESPENDHAKLKSLEELKENFNMESNNSKPFTEEEVLAKLLDPVRNGDKFNNSLRRLSWNPEPSIETSVTPPNVEDVLEFMEETNISQHEVRGVVKGVISQFLNASLSDSEFRRSRKRSHKHNNSRDSNKDKRGYRLFYKQERTFQNPPREKIAKPSEFPLQTIPTISSEDANVVLNLSLPKKVNKVHFSEMDNIYSTDSGIESYQISKSKTLSNLEFLAKVSSGQQQPSSNCLSTENNINTLDKICMDNVKPTTLDKICMDNVPTLDKICMDNVKPKQLLSTSSLHKTEITSYPAPGNATVLSKPDSMLTKKSILTSGMNAPPPVTRMVAPPVTRMVAPPPVTRMVAPPPVTRMVAPPPITRMVAPLPVSVMSASPPIPRLDAPPAVSSICAPPHVPRMGAPVSGLGGPPPLMMVTYKVDSAMAPPPSSFIPNEKSHIKIETWNDSSAVAAPSIGITTPATLPNKPHLQVEALPLIKQPSPPPLISKTVVLSPTTEQYSPKENIPIRCSTMPPTQSPPKGLPRPIPRVIVEAPSSFKKSPALPNPQPILIKPVIPFKLTVIQPSSPLAAAPTSSIKTTSRKSPVMSDSSSDEPRRSSTCNREVHNRLEKNRRAHLKKCFDDLAIEVELDPKKASNLTVIRSAYKYIQILRRKERENEHDLANLVQAKISLQNRLEHLKREFPGYKAESDCE